MMRLGTRRSFSVLGVSLGMLTIMGPQMAEAEEQPTEISIKATRIAPFGGGRVGVVAVMHPPLRSSLVVAGAASGIPFETTQTVMAGQEVLGVGRRFRVESISPGSGGASGDYGTVFLHLTSAGRSWPAAAVALTAHGPSTNEDSQLRLDGPDLEGATDARVIAWLPDEQHPTAAQVEWWPAKWGRDGNLPTDIRSARLAPGASVTFGRATAKVLAIQGASADHPARIILELQPRPAG